MEKFFLTRLGGKEKRKTYVNVHTEKNLGGEIRGQIKRVFPFEQDH